MHHDAADVTRVLPTRQKLMGLKMANGKPPGDTDKMSDVKLKQGQKIMVCHQHPCTPTSKQPLRRHL